MGPAILARADVGPFAAKIHGSALEYTVKPHPRFLPYAEEGMEAASGVLVGSRHTAESLWAALPDVEGLREKTRLGPPGVDIDEFRPWEPGHGGSGASPRTPPAPSPSRRLRRQADRLQGRRPAAGRLAAGQGCSPRGAPADRRVRRVRGRAARLLAALERGDLDDAREVARLGLGARGRGGEAAADPLGVPRRSARRLRRGGERQRPARSSSSAAWSTTRSPSCCRTPRRWSCRAPFPRPSGWSPWRLPPAGRCRSPPTTRGCGRCPGSWPRRCRRRSAG